MSSRAAPLPRCSLSPHDVVGAHHFVFLVLEDVAVVDIPELLPSAGVCAGRKIVPRDDPRDRFRIAEHRVFPSRPLVVLRRLRRLVVDVRSEEQTSELQSLTNLAYRFLPVTINTVA